MTRETRYYKCDPCDLSMTVESNRDRIRRCLYGASPRCPSCNKGMQSLGGAITETVNQPGGEFPGVSADSESMPTPESALSVWARQALTKGDPAK